MKTQDLSLVEIEEIELKPVMEFRNLWKEQLAESVNREGMETSFDKRINIIKKVEIKPFTCG